MIIPIERQSIIQFRRTPAMIAILGQRRIGVVGLQIMSSGDISLYCDVRLRRLPLFVTAAEFSEGAFAGAGVHGCDLEDFAEEGFEDWDGGDGDADKGADAVLGVKF